MGTRPVTALGARCLALGKRARCILMLVRIPFYMRFMGSTSSEPVPVGRVGVRTACRARGPLVGLARPGPGRGVRKVKVFDMAGRLFIACCFSLSRAAAPAWGGRA